ncbi:LacI family DNA-binding transcriptional regulator [Acidipila sp. EB88]|uniref:LacI family DNA-binding transcriptional regulator n=1 Tax=Acidipila sp. EB88 TaxID=2305226 RepID=UPI000F5FDF43|nr:LacI family DNA-binding transcriptional regulator [Acidipila sp. EB88]RRA47173.1 LacI family transcriptional regulator [Acidipila sp. EB88]
MVRIAKSAGTKRFDIHAVAALAGVSIATVSRTLNGVTTVDKDMAARVWKAAKKLKYVPNTQARALVSGRSRILGLIVSEITNPFFPELIQEFERKAVERGYELLIASTSYDRTKMTQCVRRMLERKVEGVAIMTFGIDEGALEAFAANNVPSVFVDLAPSYARTSTIEVDYRKGIREAVQHLAELGHEAIAFISGPARLHSAGERRRAFQESLRAAKLPCRKEWMIRGDHTLSGGRSAINSILELKDQPTAIICSNDMTAIGVQHGLFESGRQVPRDFSLVGFDDIYLAAYTIPPLTTIRMACQDLAHAAVVNLVQHIRPGETAAVKTASVPTTLVVRQTTGPRPGVRA